MKPTRARLSLRVLLLALSFLLAPAARPAGAQRATPSEGEAAARGVAYGSLEELRGKSRVRLLVVRPRVVSAGDPGLVAAEAVRAGRETERRYLWLYNAIGRRLDSYARKYGSMTNTRPSEEPDYYVVFNLLRFRQSLNGFYPSGEMYVVTYSPPGPPRILWQTEKEMYDDDATDKLIKALKAMRGER